MKCLPFLTALLSLTMLSGCLSPPRSTLDPKFQKRYHDYHYCHLQAVRQSTSSTCGPACLATILSYWGDYTSEYQVIQTMHYLPEKGCRMTQLKQMAQGQGLQAYLLSMKDSAQQRLLEQIRKGRPVICAVKYPRGYTPASELFFIGPLCNALSWVMGTRVNHYVVVFGYKDESLLLMDPAAGIVALDWERFEPCWQEQQYAALVCGKEYGRTGH